MRPNDTFALGHHATFGWSARPVLVLALCRLSIILFRSPSFINEKESALCLMFLSQVNNFLRLGSAVFSA